MSHKKTASDRDGWLGVMLTCLIHMQICAPSLLLRDASSLKQIYCSDYRTCACSNDPLLLGQADLLRLRVADYLE